MRSLAWRRPLFILQKGFINLFCKSRFPHKFVNLFVNNDGKDETVRTGRGKKKAGQDSFFQKSKDRTEASRPSENREWNPRPSARKPRITPLSQKPQPRKLPNIDRKVIFCYLTPRTPRNNLWPSGAKQVFVGSRSLWAGWTPKEQERRRQQTSCPDQDRGQDEDRPKAPDKDRGSLSRPSLPSLFIISSFCDESL